LRPGQLMINSRRLAVARSLPIALAALTTFATAAHAAGGKSPVDPAPGARPEERGRALEAEWEDLTVRARAAGGEAVSAVKVTGLKLRLFHAAPPPGDKPAGDKSPGD